MYRNEKLQNEDRKSIEGNENVYSIAWNLSDQGDIVASGIDFFSKKNILTGYYSSKGFSKQRKKI